MKCFIEDPRYPKFVYGNVCGVGQKVAIDLEMPTFFARDFLDARKTDLWSDFPEEIYYQPEEMWSLKPEEIPLNTPSLLCQSFSPQYAEWEEMITSLQKNRLPKCVLARKTSLTFEGPIDPFSVLAHLYMTCQREKIFAFFPKPGVAFLGATPEMLFKRKGSHIKTEALAGTCLLSEQNPSGENLLSSEKDVNEFLFVKREIAQCLDKICKPFSTDNSIYLKKNSYLAHLHYPFSCELLSHISDKEIISSLHPTPATCGYPKEKALSFIKDFEPFDRGWYASPLGLASKEKTEISVALRSALIKGNQMHLFMGAGIVKDSRAKSEWQELNAKMKLFGAFYGEGNSRNIRKEWSACCQTHS